MIHARMMWYVVQALVIGRRTQYRCSNWTESDTSACFRSRRCYVGHSKPQLFIWHPATQVQSVRQNQVVIKWAQWNADPQGAQAEGAALHILSSLSILPIPHIFPNQPPKTVERPPVGQLHLGRCVQCHWTHPGNKYPRNWMCWVTKHDLHIWF